MHKLFKHLLYKNLKASNCDIFITRLRSSVIGEGMLSKNNVKLIDYAIKYLPKKGDILEIGLYAGLSSNLILHYLEKYNLDVKLYGCDIWQYEGIKDNLTNKKSLFIDGKTTILRTGYDNYIKQSYINSCLLFHPKNLPFAIHTSSDIFFENINRKISTLDVFKRDVKPLQDISFCYIDGNHSYNQTKKDFENAAKITVKKGFILIDDTASHLKLGSSKFAKELKYRADFKIISKKENYLLQKI